MPQTPPTKPRLSRYQADRRAFPGLVPNERDRLMLSFLYTHRFLDTELLWHLIDSHIAREAPSARRLGFGQQALYKRLQRLFHAGYVHRLFLTDRPVGQGRGSARSVYGLGPKSSRVLPDLVGCSAQQVREIVQANRIRAPFLRHSLEVARFRVILEIACIQSAGRVRLLGWEQGRLLEDHVVSKSASSDHERRSVFPDAAFGLTTATGYIATYLLEMDLGTEPIWATGRRSDLHGKILGYHAYRQQGRFRYRYALTYSAANAASGFVALRVSDNPTFAAVRGFNVLFVTSGELSPSGVPSGRIANILSMLTTLDHPYASSTLCWFTTRDTLSLSQPRRILGPVWLVPNPHRGLQRLGPEEP